jgi:hypothetical protein
MDGTMIDSDWTEEATVTSEFSDEALEAAARTAGGPAFASSLNFSSFHLACC